MVSFVSLRLVEAVAGLALVIVSRDHLCEAVLLLEPPLHDTGLVSVVLEVTIALGELKLR